MQIIWILRKTSAQQHLFHSFSMEKKKTDKKQKRKKKSTLCLTICWTISQRFGIWPVRLEGERVYFEFVGSIFQSQFLLITQFISTWSSNWIQSTLLALKPNYNQRKETNEFNPCNFVPETWHRRTLYIRTRPEAAAPSSSESHQGQKRQTDNTKWEQVLGRFASGEIPNVFCVRCDCLTKSAESSTVRAVAGSSV